MSPVGIDALDAAILGPIQDIGLLAFVGGLFLGVVVLVRRYRGAGRVDILFQIRWVGAAGVLPMLLFPVLGARRVVLHAVVALSGLLPVAIGIAILRYRLYDIDRIISRTLAWALVTGLFGRGVRWARGRPHRGARPCGRRTFAVAGSTLVTFALFQPLRRQVPLVDRWFDRARTTVTA